MENFGLGAGLKDGTESGAASSGFAGHLANCRPMP